MRRFNLLIGAVALFFCFSCQKNIETNRREPVILNAVSCGIGKETKTETSFRYDVLWSEGDNICVIDGPGNRDTFTLTGGEGTANGVFAQDGTTPLSDNIQAYYPVSIVRGKVLKWPSVQTAEQAIPMYAKKTLNSRTGERIDFTSLGSVLQIVFNSIEDNITLTSIEIKDSEKTMSGEFDVDENGMACITATDKAGIMMDFGTEGIALGRAANYFNISVPAGNYRDLTLVFTAKDGSKCTMTGGRLNVPHNTVCRLTLSGEKFVSPVPPGVLPGAFTVSKDNGLSTTRVYFSRGNLWIDEEMWFAGFEAEQLNFNRVYGTPHVSYFTWSSDIQTAMGKTFSGTSLFCDEQRRICVIDSDSHTFFYALSSAEWGYLLGNSEKRAGRHKNDVTVCDVEHCLLIAPDECPYYTFDNSKTSYSANEWAEAEAAGIVCLSPTGCRLGNGVEGAYDYGCYWTSTSDVVDDTRAFVLSISSDGVNPEDRRSRGDGCAIRLVTELPH